MPATIGPYLTVGSMYSITGFDVARCNPNFRLSDSSSFDSLANSSLLLTDFKAGRCSTTVEVRRPHQSPLAFSIDFNLTFLLILLT
ncbi:hypothetical protein HID58_092727 [Brassica napus]|uniref:Uncharacterized protein n=1 Tax=Brassica napus TaxID=3708 RepID=A0ABQ7XDR5_BRANA|nr:hypothetical protein HID58_092727 [Brassica napus]